MYVPFKRLKGTLFTHGKIPSTAVQNFYPLQGLQPFTTDALDGEASGRGGPRGSLRTLETSSWANGD